jgi:hypothetical protein
MSAVSGEFSTVDIGDFTTVFHRQAVFSSGLGHGTAVAGPTKPNPSLAAA